MIKFIRYLYYKKSFTDKKSVFILTTSSSSFEKVIWLIIKELKNYLNFDLSIEFIYLFRNSELEQRISSHHVFRAVFRELDAFQ